MKFLLKCKQLLRALFLKSSFGNGRALGWVTRDKDSLGRGIPSASQPLAPASLWAITRGRVPWAAGVAASSSSFVQPGPSAGNDAKRQVLSCHQLGQRALAEVRPPPFCPPSCVAGTFLSRALLHSSVTPAGVRGLGSRSQAETKEASGQKSFLHQGKLEPEIPPSLPVQHLHRDGKRALGVVSILAAGVLWVQVRVLILALAALPLWEAPSPSGR